PSPTRSSVSGKVSTHGQPKDFVRASGEHFWRTRVQSNERFALRSTFVRQIDIAAKADRGDRTALAHWTVFGEVSVFVPPGRVVGTVLRQRRCGESKSQNGKEDGKPKDNFHG